MSSVIQLYDQLRMSHFSANQRNYFFGSTVTCVPIYQIQLSSSRFLFSGSPGHHLCAISVPIKKIQAKILNTKSKLNHKKILS